jgi:3-dehydroshikimate dehydratase
VVRPGLVSVTFRSRTCEEVIALAAQANLEAIEWGGDVHVPHGDLGRAKQVARMTRERGLAIAAYGSYYYTATQGSPPFEDVIATAKTLEAPLIRIWAGRVASAQADDAYWEKFAAETWRISNMAADEGLAIAYEYHGDSLTDSDESVRKLMRLCPQQNLAFYWHMGVGEGRETCIRNLRTVLPRLANLHVSWNNIGANDSPERRPLEEGRLVWVQCLSIANGAAGSRWALIEFVAGDTPEQFTRDAGVLRELLTESNAWGECPSGTVE